MERKKDKRKMDKYKKVYIEITNSCNLNCSFCFPVKKEKRFMTEEEFEHVLEEVSKVTKVIYLHVKGEPLLHPKIIDFLKLAEKYNLKVNLTTNGTLFPKLVEKLKDCKALHKINFSLHCEQNIPNYEEEIFKNVQKLSPDTVIIYRLWTLQNNKLDEKSTKTVEKLEKYYELSPETVDKLKTENNVKISSTIYVDKDNEFAWPKITEEKTTGYCHALKTQIAILVDGTVVPCCLDSDGVIALGNIYKDTFEEIQKSARYQKLKKSFQDRKPCEKLCQSCTFKNR